MSKVYPDWRTLRDKIYKRDNGICWVCGLFTDMADYNLGHIIDRCNGGQLDPDNLAVMHMDCNMSKPKHHTKEEAIAWQSTFNLEKTESEDYRIRREDEMERRERAKQSIISYFTKRPNLLIGTRNHDRSEAMLQLSEILDISIVLVRQYMVEGKLVQPKKVSKKADRYFYIAAHLQELYTKYCSITHTSHLTATAKELNLSTYGIDIMLYLAGYPNKVMPQNLHSISKRVNELGINITQIQQ